MASTKAMTLRLPVDLAEQLEAVAAIDGKPIAEVVRVAIANFIRKRKADPAFQLALLDWIQRLEALADLSTGTAGDWRERHNRTTAVVQRWTATGDLNLDTTHR